ncbi:hypothetical protein EVJ24_14890 [Exiguobacterium sp. SH1S21]|uniref:helix-turn-helix domain-containing protein n=1 Tax=Exiguobacterium sp. SH1S21 TaxID=2510953 RepID=UPI00103B21F5|nr:helix-turn-helix domain-containing protein [Exiguobacterium sp. SH1S21]TCI50325.1 hypothetical protein EVJ24_14890 [Exiguobacterium sp. SH1S21]
MTIGEFFELIAQGKKVKEIAALYGRDPAVISRALKSHGYTYEGKSRGYTFSGKGKEPLDAVLLDSPFVHHRRKESHDDYSLIDSPVIHQDWLTDSSRNHQVGERMMNVFTNEDKVDRLLKLVDAAPQLLQVLENVQRNETGLGRAELAQREYELKLEGGSKTRRTISTDKKTLETFDNFCDERNLDKGTIIQLALKDLMEKYNN